MIIEKNELFDIVGGGTVSGTFINSMVKLVSTILTLGRIVGSAIRTSRTGIKCN